MNNIYNLTIEDLENYFLSIGEKKFKALQLYSWLYEKKVNSFDLMSDVKKTVIERLKTDFSIEHLKLVKVERDTEVNKYLFELYDGSFVESVLMRHDYGTSICVSSQVGCNMGCSFCESGRLKKVRDLALAELVGQVICVSKYEQVRIDSIVVMGIGEPFDNFENIKRFIKVVTDPKMINIGQRHLTISTCGLVPKIYEFADLETGVNLAISLHAPNNEIRDKIMKVNHGFKIEKVMEALDYYIKKTNRRVTIEYIMLEGINDSDKCAHELVNLVKGKLMYVNLIPYNETTHFELKRSNDFKIKSFYDILKSNDINVTIRKEMGGNLSAACGQLRANSERL